MGILFVNTCLIHKKEPASYDEDSSYGLLIYFLLLYLHQLTEHLLKLL